MRWGRFLQTNMESSSQNLSAQVNRGYVLATEDSSLPIERCLPVSGFDANQRRRPACSGHIEWPSVIRLSSLDSCSVFDNATG